MPITWRDLVTTTVQDASRPMEAATRTFDNAFDRAAQTVNTQQQVNQDALDRSRDSQLVAIQQLYDAAKTPEAVQALQGSEQVKALQAGLDPARLAKLIGYGDTRQAAVQQNLLANRDFAEKDALYQHRDTITNAMAKATSGDIDGAMAGIEPLKGTPVYGQVAEKLALAHRGYTQYAMDMAAKQSNISRDAAAGQLDSARVDDMVKQRANEAARISNEYQLKVMEDYRKAVGDLAKGSAGGVAGGTGGADAPGGGRVGLYGILDKVLEAKDPNRDKILKKAAEIEADPANAYLTPEEKVSIAVGSTDTRGFFEKLYKAAPGNADEMIAKIKASGNYGERIKLADTVDKLRQNEVIMLNNALLRRLGQDPSALPKPDQAAGATAIAATGTPGTPGAAPAGTPAEGSRSYRNNNPGNLKYGDFAQSMGATGKDKDGFAIFPSRDIGDEAQRRLLQGGSYRDLSLADAINRYAPPKENNTSRYQQVVANTGLDMSKKIKDLSPAEFNTLVTTMQQHEGWYPGTAGGNTANDGTAPSQPSQAGVASSLLNQPVQSNEPIWQNKLSDKAEERKKLLVEQAALERDEIAAGKRDSYSPEVQPIVDQMKAQEAKDRKERVAAELKAALVNGEKGIHVAAMPAAAVLDALSFPLRAGREALRSAGRLANAYGGTNFDVPDTPFEFMPNINDKMRAINTLDAPQALTDRRKALEEKFKALAAKKAKG